ncbi:hypothetical protein Tco_0040864, partial [Tanacetum coccineum]
KKDRDFEAKFPAIILGNINAVTSPSPEIPYYKSAQGTTMREYEVGKEDSEIEFPAIVLDNTSTSDTTVSYEPTEYYGGQVDFSDMAPLPAADQRHLWLRYQVKGYTKGIVHSYEQRLKNDKRMPAAPLVREFILEFLSTCKMSDTEMGLDVADTLCFQLGGVRRRMTWRQFILALGLHTKQEIAKAGGQAPEKVTGVDLFYLRSMDRGTTNVPHLLAQYLFRYAEGRKSGARLSVGHFIGRLAMHFGLDSDEGLRGLQVVTREFPLIDLHELGRLNICSRYGDTWAWVAPGLERQQVAVAGAHEADEAGSAVDEGAHDVPAPA